MLEQPENPYESPKSPLPNDQAAFISEKSQWWPRRWLVLFIAGLVGMLASAYYCGWVLGWDSQSLRYMGVVVGSSVVAILVADFVAALWNRLR